MTKGFHKPRLKSKEKSKDISSDSSLSRNKLLKNKTLPNLFNYKSKASLNKSTKSITKMFMNPGKKYSGVKELNKTFIDSHTSSQSSTLKHRIYESSSASKSGGTGEPNYVDLKLRTGGKLGSSQREDDGSSALKNVQAKSNSNIYAAKINLLAKENSQLRADFGKIQKDMENLDRRLEESK